MTTVNFFSKRGMPVSGSFDTAEGGDSHWVDLNLSSGSNTLELSIFFEDRANMLDFLSQLAADCRASLEKYDILDQHAHCPRCAQPALDAAGVEWPQCNCP